MLILNLLYLAASKSSFILYCLSVRVSNYAARILSAEASLPASPYWASSLSAHAPCRTAAVCAAPNVHWTSDTSDHVGVDVQSVSIAQSQGLLEHFSVSSCGNFLLVGLDSS